MTRRRRIDDDFLVQVVAVYVANSKWDPTAAVAREFGVKHRMAGVYVNRARIAGLLPATTQGRTGLNDETPEQRWRRHGYENGWVQ